MHSFAPAGHVVPSEAAGYEHALLLHVAPELTWHTAGVAQVFPQPPQLLASLAVCFSHPSALTPLQSA